MSGTVPSSRVTTRNRVLAATGFVAITATTAAIVAFAPHCSKHEQPQVLSVEKPRIWCKYDPSSEDLMVYRETQGQKKGAELGESSLVSLQGHPLAVACQDENIWIVTKKSVVKGSILSDPNCCSVSPNQEISHVRAPEYSMEGTEVIAASTWFPVGNARPAVATVTNNGWFQVFTPPNSGPVIEENFIINLRTNNVLDEITRWPDNVTSAAVGVLGHDAFSVIPFGPGSKLLYYLGWPGGGYKPLLDLDIWTIDIRSSVPNAAYISGSSPIIYNADRGGWVAILNVVTTDGKQVEIPQVVIPREVLLQKTTP
ncbi:MAG: hypothetical protein ABH842_05420 [Candidatus Micrarchaeota archaeon]